MERTFYPVVGLCKSEGTDVDPMNSLRHNEQCHNGRRIRRCRLNFGCCHGKWTKRTKDSFSKLEREMYEIGAIGVFCNPRPVIRFQCMPRLRSAQLEGCIPLPCGFYFHGSTSSASPRVLQNTGPSTTDFRPRDASTRRRKIFQFERNP